MRQAPSPPAATADALLAALERDLPVLREEMGASFERFEARAYGVFAVEDSPRVQRRLQDLLRDAGVA